MVFLAISKAGLSEALRLSLAGGQSVWCGADAISEQDFEALGGVKLSRFEYSLNGEPEEVVSGAVATINEHHPNETVWVERAPSEA